MNQDIKENEKFALNSSTGNSAPKITEVPSDSDIKIVVEFLLNKGYGFSSLEQIIDGMIKIYNQKHEEKMGESKPLKFYLVITAYGLPNGNDAFKEIGMLITTDKKNDLKTAKWDNIIFYNGDGAKFIETTAFALNKISGSGLENPSRMKVIPNYKGVFDPYKVEEYFV